MSCDLSLRQWTHAERRPMHAAGWGAQRGAENGAVFNGLFTITGKNGICGLKPV